jgi:AAA domain/DnaB-like helicase N terminal domain
VTDEPPHDITAEQHLLGAMMWREDVIPDVYRQLGDQAEQRNTAFYRPAHRLIYNAILAVFDKGTRPEPPFVAQELTRRGDLTRVGGAPYLHTIYEGVPTVANAGKYAEIVVEKYAARGVLALGERLQQAAESGGLDTAREMVETWLDHQTHTPATDDAVTALMAEMLTTDDLDQVPTLEPLIGEVLYRDTLARMIGPSGGGKSFVGIDFAGHVATGQPWNGRPVHHGKVVYLVAEGAKGFRKRVRAWEQHHGMRMDGVLFLPRPVQAGSPEWPVLIEACRRLDAAFIVIDTQARITVGVEENSATEMGLIVDRMEQLRAATGACVLLVHHKGLQGEHARGSTAVKAALQTELVVSKVGHGRETMVTLSSEKQKDGEDLDRISFELRQVRLDGEAHDDGRPVTSAILVRIADTDAGLLPGGVLDIVQKLDAANIPTRLGRDKVRTQAAKLGLVLPRNDVLSEAIRIRRNRTSDLSPDTPQNSPGTGQEQTDIGPVPGHGTETTISPGQTCPGQVRDSGTAGTQAQPVPLSPPPRGGQAGQVGQPQSPDPACTSCGARLDPLFAAESTLCTICAVKEFRNDRPA